MTFKYAIIPTIIATSLLQAEPSDIQMRNFDKRLSAVEQKQKQKMITAPARPEVVDGFNLFVEGDFIFWQAHVDNLPIAVKNRDLNINLDHSRGKNLDYRWDPGFRIALGYNIPHDAWDLSLAWLRLFSEAHNKFFASNGQALWASQAHPGDADGFDAVINIGLAFSKVPAHWHAHLNQLDLDLGREFFVSKWLSLRPHFGIRSTWLHQKLKAAYKHPIFVGDHAYEVKKGNHWWGIGPEAGLDTDWGLGKGFSLYGNIAASIEFGFHHLKARDEDKTDEVVNVHFKDSFHVSHPILDLQIGLTWDHMFAHDRFHLGFHAGWEQHIYFSQNQFPYFEDDISIGSYSTNNGDLTYQGISLGARFDF